MRNKYKPSSNLPVGFIIVSVICCKHIIHVYGNDNYTNIILLLGGIPYSNTSPQCNVHYNICYKPLKVKSSPGRLFRESVVLSYSAI